MRFFLSLMVDNMVTVWDVLDIKVKEENTSINFRIIEYIQLDVIDI